MVASDMNADNAVKWTVGLGIIIHYVTMTMLLFFVAIPEGRAGEAVILLIGSSSNMVGLIVGYYFGSSRASHVKDEAISKLAGR